MNDSGVGNTFSPASLNSFSPAQCLNDKIFYLAPKKEKGKLSKYFLIK
jgi:hypothetical protein